MNWTLSAASTIYREMDRIEGEALHAGQVAQDPDADKQIWIEEIEKIIIAAFEKCPECGGSGKRWYALRGTDVCGECHGTKKRYGGGF